MTQFLLTIGLVLAVLFFVAFLREKYAQKKNEDIALNYEPVGPLVNKSEYQLLQAVRHALPPGYAVMIKVRLEDIVRVRNGIGQHVRLGLRNRIKSRHVDFAVCDSVLRVVAVIELDGASHNSAEVQRGDVFKDVLFAHVGIPLYRIRVGDDFAARVGEVMDKIKRTS